MIANGFVCQNRNLWSCALDHVSQKNASWSRFQCVSKCCFWRTVQSKQWGSSSMSCPNGFRAVQKTDCRACRISSRNQSTLQNGLKIPVLLPTVRKKRAIHQFWALWNATRVSLSSSQITKRSIIVHAILGSHFVTASISVNQHRSSKSRASSRANALTNVGPMSWTISLSFF